MDKGLIQKASVEVVAMAIWGLVHGMVSLVIRDRLDHINKKVTSKEHLTKMMYQSINWLLGSIDISIKKK